MIMRSQDSLKAGAVAKAAGVGVQTLHYYERLGLLQKPKRSAANLSALLARSDPSRPIY